MDIKLKEIYQRYQRGGAVTLTDLEYLYSKDRQGAEQIVKNIVEGHAPVDHGMTNQANRKQSTPEHMAARQLETRQLETRQPETRQLEAEQLEAGQLETESDILGLIRKIIKDAKRNGQAMKDNLFLTNKEIGRIVSELRVIEGLETDFEKKYSIQDQTESVFNEEI
ncbi:MAG: hypothetical protein ACK5ML_06415 [Lachnospiraceae bacterium]